MTSRQLDSLTTYCNSLARLADKKVQSGAVFSKILTHNDDSGRHGVLVPIEAYDFFPELIIDDPEQNATCRFLGFSCSEIREVPLAYKYYQRYPERRITRLGQEFDDRNSGQRLAIFLHATHTDGSQGYYFDIVRERVDPDFLDLWLLLFGNESPRNEGIFTVRSTEAPPFASDAILDELLAKFDAVRERGWVDSLRSGDTGIGYTFETLIGIKENNDRQADFKGIEIKCKKKKDSGSATGKINLFQQAPVWATRLSSINRLHVIGQPDPSGRFSCYSQVTSASNNLGLRLEPDLHANQIDLLKYTDQIGHWPHRLLEKRLHEKHSRSVFVTAEVSNGRTGQRFQYDELVYCERPSISQFLGLVRENRVVFEFLMSEKEGGRVRNHGYPWRLIGEGFLKDLFSLRVKLR